MLKILQRYVLRETLVPTFMAAATLSFVLLLQMVFSEADELAGLISFGLLVRFMIYLLPVIMTLSIPMALLVGVLIGIGRMAADSEIKALRAQGVNLFPLFLPIVGVGAVASVVVLANSLYFAPTMFWRSFRMIEERKFEMIESLEPGRFWDNFSAEGADVVLHFGGKDEETGDLQNVYLSIEGGYSQLTEPSSIQTARRPDQTAASRTPAAIRFDGAESTAFDFPDRRPMTSLTLAVRCRLTSPGAPRTILHLEGRGGAEAAPLGLSLGVDAAGTPRFVERRAVAQETVLVGPENLMADGRWHELLAARRGAEEGWTFHVDGKKADEGPAFAGTASLQQVTVGARSAYPDTDYWAGETAGVLVAASALTRVSGAPDAPFPPIEKAALLWPEPPATKSGEEEPEQAAPGNDEEAEPAQRRSRTLLLASSGRLQGDRERRAASMTLYDGTIHLMREPKDPSYTVVDFKRLHQEFVFEQDDDKRKAESMTIWEILAEMRWRAEREERVGGERDDRIDFLRSVIYERVSISLACFAFALIGAPLAVWVRPSGKSIGVSIAFGLILAYYGILNYGVQLVRDASPLGPPLVFLPIVLLTILGGLMLHRTVHR